MIQTFINSKVENTNFFFSYFTKFDLFSENLSEFFPDFSAIERGDITQ
jgi:hypothetical protein